MALSRLRLAVDIAALAASSTQPWVRLSFDE